MTTHTPGDDTPAWLRGSHPVEADLSTLAEFAKALMDELNLNFRPHAMRTVNQFVSPAFIAPEGFVELTEAHATYSDSVERIRALLDAHSSATWDLATAAETVARRYRDSDAYSASTVGDVRGALDGAAPEGQY
jgi:hypothetical protein